MKLTWQISNSSLLTQSRTFELNQSDLTFPRVDFYDDKTCIPLRNGSTYANTRIGNYSNLFFCNERNELCFGRNNGLTFLTPDLVMIDQIGLPDSCGIEAVNHCPHSGEYWLIATHSQSINGWRPPVLYRYIPATRTFVNTFGANALGTVSVRMPAQIPNTYQCNSFFLFNGFMYVGFTNEQPAFRIECSAAKNDGSGSIALSTIGAPAINFGRKLSNDLAIVVSSSGRIIGINPNHSKRFDFAMPNWGGVSSQSSCDFSPAKNNLALGANYRLQIINNGGTTPTLGPTVVLGTGNVLNPELGSQLDACNFISPIVSYSPVLGAYLVFGRRGYVIVNELSGEIVALNQLSTTTDLIIRSDYGLLVQAKMDALTGFNFVTGRRSFDNPTFEGLFAFNAAQLYDSKINFDKDLRSRGIESSASGRNYMLSTSSSFDGAAQVTRLPFVDPIAWANLDTNTQGQNDFYKTNGDFHLTDFSITCNNNEQLTRPIEFSGYSRGFVFSQKPNLRDLLSNPNQKTIRLTASVLSKIVFNRNFKLSLELLPNTDLTVSMTLVK